MQVQFVFSNEIKEMSGDKDTHTIKDFRCLDATQNTKEAAQEGESIYRSSLTVRIETQESM